MKEQVRKQQKAMHKQVSDSIAPESKKLNLNSEISYSIFFEPQSYLKHLYTKIYKLQKAVSKSDFISSITLSSINGLVTFTEGNIFKYLHKKRF